MKRCPITYDIIGEDESYSAHGLRKLSPRLKYLQPFSLTAAEQRQEVIARAGKMSIQGVQPKLSAILNIKNNQFEVVDQNGQYIIKTQSESYSELPENEALSMTLAEQLKLKVPVHGLIYAKDGSFAYFIKRFDRYGKNKKIAVEDFAQLSEENRETKYNSSMEKVAKLINKYCTFPVVENITLFKLILFNYLIGNEDMHLKNFSLITDGNITKLSPVYDLLNTTIAQPGTREELALPLNGKKSNLRRKDFIDYLAIDLLKLKAAVISEVLSLFKQAVDQWRQLISVSFLSESMKQKYLKLLDERWTRLEL